MRHVTFNPLLSRLLQDLFMFHFFLYENIIIIQLKRFLYVSYICKPLETQKVDLQHCKIIRAEQSINIWQNNIHANLF